MIFCVRSGLKKPCKNSFLLCFLLLFWKDEKKKKLFEIEGQIQRKLNFQYIPVRNDKLDYTYIFTVAKATSDHRWLLNYLHYKCLSQTACTSKSKV